MRTPIPEDIAAEVLFRHNRTCCVCNEPGKAIQIHHIDGNPSSHSASNLAVGRYNRSEITLGRSSRITPKELLDGQLSMAERHCSGAATSSWQGRNHHN